MSPNLKHDTAAFLDVSARLLSAGYRVRFRAHGTSMRPALRDGEPVTVEVVEPAAVKPGDIVLYRHRQRLFAHRVVEVDQDGDTVVGFVLRGDTKAACDAPIKPEQVLGRVVTTLLEPASDAWKVERRRSFVTRGIFILCLVASYVWSRRGSARRHHALAPRATRHA